MQSSSARRGPRVSALRLLTPTVSFLATLTLALALTACSGQGGARTAKKPVRVEIPAPPAPPPEPRKADLPETLVVLDEGAEEEPTTLVEASRRERERKRRETDSPEGEKKRLVINDENLSEHAQGQVTVASAPEREEAGPADALEDLAEDETYWRNGARERRLRLRRAADEVDELEEQVEDLRTRFYAEDDPYVRDGSIKPSWDRSLDRLRQAREDIGTYRQELDDFLEEGRQAGALPGWLREGLELEPDPAELEDSSADPTRGEMERHRSRSPDRAGGNG
jgi:hypothetical protein